MQQRNLTSKGSEVPFIYNPNDPVSLKNEQDRAEAVRIGRELDGAGASRLPPLLHSASPIVRKMAASAMRKLIEARPGAYESLFATFLQFSLEDESAPQVLAYKLKALGACGRYAPLTALDTIRDLMRDETRPAYVLAAANDALKLIEAAVRAASVQQNCLCTACHRYIPDLAQRERSLRKYTKPYCRHCQDEKDLENVLFTRSVEAAKHRLTAAGVWVQSKGEKRIADYLARQNIAFDYDQRLRLVGERLLRPDFYLPEFDVYIEYWGMDTPDYLATKQDKKFYYQKAGKKLVSIGWQDDAHLEAVLEAKLGRYVKLFCRAQG